MEKIAILTVNYNNYEVTKDFIESFKKQVATNFHIFIADLSEKREHITTNSIGEVIFTKNNGYAHGVNICLKSAIERGYRKFVVINNDVEVNESFVAAVDSVLKENKNTIVGGKIYYFPGFEYHKDRYKTTEEGKVLWYAGGEIDWDNMIVKHRGVNKVDKGDYDKLTKTDFVTGCLMCFDKNVVDTIGYWDESYFLYYEDTDWCERAKRRGIKLVYDPSIIIWHKNAQSTGGSGSNLHSRYLKKNRLRFALKYAPLRTNFHLIKNLVFEIINLFLKRR